MRICERVRGCFSIVGAASDELFQYSSAAGYLLFVSTPPIDCVFLLSTATSIEKPFPQQFPLDVPEGISFKVQEQRFSR